MNNDLLMWEPAVPIPHFATDSTTSSLGVNLSVQHLLNFNNPENSDLQDQPRSAQFGQHYSHLLLFFFMIRKKCYLTACIWTQLKLGYAMFVKSPFTRILSCLLDIWLFTTLLDLCSAFCNYLCLFLLGRDMREKESELKSSNFCQWC